MREFFLQTALTLVLTPFILLCIQSVGAQVMQSNSYRIQSDSINFGGGFSSSTNYNLESTAGEVATGESSSATYNLKAGYQQMQSVFISMAGGANVSLSPSIPGLSGGTSNGSTTVTVTTDSAGGYTLTIAASQSPAMQKDGDTIADYVPAGDPDYTFTTGAADSHLGFSPEGVDVVQRFLDDAVSACNEPAGVDTHLTCWEGLSTSAETIAQSTGPNQPDGATTSVFYRVGIGGSVVQPPGTYTATTTLTALPL